MTPKTRLEKNYEDYSDISLIERNHRHRLPTDVSGPLSLYAINARFVFVDF